MSKFCLKCSPGVCLCGPEEQGLDMPMPCTACGGSGKVWRRVNGGTYEACRRHLPYGFDEENVCWSCGGSGQSSFGRRRSR